MFYEYYTHNINTDFIFNNFIADFNCLMLHPGENVIVKRANKVICCLYSAQPASHQREPSHPEHVRLNSPTKTRPSFPSSLAPKLEKYTYVCPTSGHDTFCLLYGSPPQRRQQHLNTRTKKRRKSQKNNVCKANNHGRPRRPPVGPGHLPRSMDETDGRILHPPNSRRRGDPAGPRRPSRRHASHHPGRLLLRLGILRHLVPALDRQRGPPGSGAARGRHPGLQSEVRVHARQPVLAPLQTGQDVPVLDARGGPHHTARADTLPPCHRHCYRRPRNRRGGGAAALRSAVRLRVPVV